MAPQSVDTLDILNPDLYVERGYPHEEWAVLRREAPVYWYQRDNCEPFWAITRHADIIEVSRHPELFRSTQRLFVTIDEPDVPPPEEALLRQLLNMNPPEHGAYRSVVSRRFTPAAVNRLSGHVQEIAAELIDGIAGREECDFVTDVSAKLPLAVIAEMFGIPHSDWQMMFRLSNAMIGPADPEYSGGASIREGLEAARMEFFEYFNRLVADRRQNPRDDLATALAVGRVGAEEIPPFELLSYFALLIIAGNETTRNATTGGLFALIDNPEQWELLKRDSSLIRSATEEIIRWTSPVIQFNRVATADSELHGQKIRAGDEMALFYPSANRDEDVFDQPFKFDLRRQPNYHLAFGIAEHFCLGANLARLELQMIFREIAARMDRIELAGPIARMRSSFVGGIKHMRIRYKMRAKAA
jgi:cytochrome P450